MGSRTCTHPCKNEVLSFSLVCSVNKGCDTVAFACYLYAIASEVSQTSREAICVCAFLLARLRVCARACVLCTRAFDPSFPVSMQPQMAAGSGSVLFDGNQHQLSSGLEDFKPKFVRIVFPALLIDSQVEVKARVVADTV